MGQRPTAVVLRLVALLSLLLPSLPCAFSQGPGSPATYGPIADGTYDPWVPCTNASSPGCASADHTTGAPALSDYQTAALQSLTHFIFVVLSEDSFDNLMATFPGVNNLQALLSSNSYPLQMNYTPNTANVPGSVYPSLPADSTNKIPAGLPNAPYNIASAIPGASLGTIFSNPSHNFHQTQLKINGGKEDGWIYWSSNKSPTMGMGYYDLSSEANTGLWQLGSQYLTFDRFHVGSFGDQVCAHMYTVGAATPPYDSANPGVCPPSIANQSSAAAGIFAPVTFNGSTWILSDPSFQPSLSRDCYLIGDVVSPNLCADAGDLVFPLIPNSVSNPKHFGDLADGAGLSWAYYSENFTLSENTDCKVKDGWNRHESSLQHFSTFNVLNSTYWLQHQKDSSQFFSALASGSLEQVTWYRPNQYHDYGFSNNDPAAGAAFVDSFFASVYASPLWQQGQLGVLVAFSDANGMFDHVPPYVGDRFGPGVRVPAFFVSPYHNRTMQPTGVNSSPYEHYSYFKMLARRFGIASSSLQAMWGTPRFLAAADLTSSFPLAAPGQTPTYSGNNGGSTGPNNPQGNRAGQTRALEVNSVLVVLVAALLAVLSA